MKDTTKTPRLYISMPLKQDQPLTLAPAHAHYLKSVLRLNEGDTIRVFNGHDGEWLANLDSLGKKTATATPQEQTHAQPTQKTPVHLLFAPIKKNRMDILIEKAVELGVTALHPVITAHTEVRKLNAERMNAQIIEASEQCERLDIPQLHEPGPLKQIIEKWPHDYPVYWAAEREEEAIKLAVTTSAQAFIIGPEGGFDAKERRYLSAHKNIRPLSLGPQILRAETAAITCLSYAMLLQDTKK